MATWIKSHCPELIGLWLAICSVLALTPIPAKAAAGKLVEQVEFDWDHSGSPTTFTLFLQQQDRGPGDADILVIKSKGHTPWTFKNHDDLWTNFTDEGLADLEKQNLTASIRLLFVSAKSPGSDRTYLFLKGGSSGCCVGSLTVLTPGPDGEPRVVFYSEQHLIASITPVDGGIRLTGQPSDSEARALKDAQSYDPYRVYLFRGDKPAQYDLDLSKAYTIAHYCQWHGPTYDERFVAVGRTTGANHCKVMSEHVFETYRQRHQAMFPEQ